MGGGVILPNVSVAEDDLTTVYFNPYVPMNIITYEASAKLAETTSSSSSGLHTNAFNGTNGQLTITSHTFENGVGIIKFNGDVISIGEIAFMGTGLTSIIIPDSVTSIGYQAFTYCTRLTSITIGSSVTSIGEEAFSDCTGLTSITIPDSVTSIGETAFYMCTSLTSITIGSGITSIGNYALCNCSALTNIICNATTAPTIQNDTFQNIKTGGTLTVPNNSTGYDVWMGTGDYYLGSYNWTKVEQ